MFIASLATTGALRQRVMWLLVSGVSLDMALLTEGAQRFDLVSIKIALLTEGAQRFDLVSINISLLTEGFLFAAGFSTQLSIG